MSKKTKNYFPEDEPKYLWFVFLILIFLFTGEPDIHDVIIQSFQVYINNQSF